MRAIWRGAPQLHAVLAYNINSERCRRCCCRCCCQSAPADACELQAGKHRLSGCNSPLLSSAACPARMQLQPTKTAACNCYLPKLLLMLLLILLSASVTVRPGSYLC